MIGRCYFEQTSIHLCARHHALPEFSPVDIFGEGGAFLSETLERYDFDKHHSKAKEIYFNTDVLHYGLGPLGLLLFFGDLATARRGIAKVLDAHERLLARVQEGLATPEYYSYETAVSLAFSFASCLLLVGNLDSMRAFMEHSLAGAASRDETMRA